MLKVEHVTKYYGDLCAVDDLSFEVKKGEIFGLLGANGAGKTTTFRIILSLLDANEGKVTLNGKKIDYEQLEKVGFVPEERSLLTKMTVQDQLLYYGKLKGMAEEDIVKKMDELLEKFDILDDKGRKIKELSKGNQQKVQFISAILNDPILLILDEPFTGLDPINVKKFKEVIMDLKEKGCMIIFSSQKMNIFIQGDISKEVLEEIEGVEQVLSVGGEFLVKIQNESIVKKVFQVAKKYDLTKFVVEDASLNEIFIDKVGAIL